VSKVCKYARSGRVPRGPSKNEVVSPTGQCFNYANPLWPKRGRLHSPSGVVSLLFLQPDGTKKSGLFLPSPHHTSRSGPVLPPFPILPGSPLFMSLLRTRIRHLRPLNSSRFFVDGKEISPSFFLLMDASEPLPQVIAHVPEGIFTFLLFSNIAETAGVRSSRCVGRCLRRFEIPSCIFGESLTCGAAR